MEGLYKNIIIRPQYLELPVSTDFLKSGRERVLVDIGFGNGEFPIHLAGKNRNDIVYGIEVSLFCIKKALKRISRSGAENFRIIRGDARFLLREYFPDLSIDSLYMNFPCPWPKKRHIKRRVTNPSFMDTVASVLKIGSHFEVATDEEWYAREVADAMNSHKALCVSDIVLNPKREITTKYERKWMEEGKKIFLIKIKKVSSFSTARLIQEVDKTMHYKVPGISVTLEDLRAMKGISGKDGESNYVYLHAYTDCRGAFLLETVTSDDFFEQRSYIRLVNRDEGLMIKVDDTSTPFRTPALKLALRNIYERFSC